MKLLVQNKNVKPQGLVRSAFPLFAIPLFAIFMMQIKFKNFSVPRHMNCPLPYTVCFSVQLADLSSFGRYYWLWCSGQCSCLLGLQHSNQTGSSAWGLAWPNTQTWTKNKDGQMSECEWSKKNNIEMGCDKNCSDLMMHLTKLYKKIGLMMML